MFPLCEWDALACFCASVLLLWEVILVVCYGGTSTYSYETGE